jgi:hypothetical protein
VTLIIISNASGGGGMVDSVTAGDLSIVVGGTASAPTIETGTLDEIAALHPPAGNWSNNSKKITALANGSGAQDAAAFGQIGTAVAVETARAEAAEALLVPLSDLPLSVANGGTGQATAVAALAALGGTPGLVSVQALAAPAASITFSAIPGTYSQIRLIVVGASSTAAEATRWKVLVNGDSGSDYDIQGVVGAGNNVNAGADNAAATQQWIAASGGSGLDLPGANATAGVAGILEVVIPAYAATTLQKTGLWRSGYIDGATGVTSADAGVWGQVVAWRSTAAIASLVIEAAAGNLITGTTALLYLT